MYVFDSNSFIELSHFYPDRFPSLWERINQYVNDGNIVSVREAYAEVTNTSDSGIFDVWIKKHKAIFKQPTSDEVMFVAEIFKIKNYTDMVRKKQILRGMPVADPFVIASGKVNDFCVVTEESFKENSAKIPNICKHFGVSCTNLEGFMKLENWLF